MEYNELKSMLQLMELNAKEAKKIGDDICKLFNSSDDILFGALNELQDCEITAEEAFSKILSYNLSKD